jgi:hypothetical protein
MGSANSGLVLAAWPSGSKHHEWAPFPTPAAACIKYQRRLCAEFPGFCLATIELWRRWRRALFRDRHVGRVVSIAKELFSERFPKRRLLLKQRYGRLRHRGRTQAVFDLRMHIEAGLLPQLGGSCDPGRRRGVGDGMPPGSGLFIRGIV